MFFVLSSSPHGGGGCGAKPLVFSRDFFFLVLSAHVAAYWIKQGHKASFTLGVKGCEAYDGPLLLRLLFLLTESFPKIVLPAHLSKWKSAPLSQKKNEVISAHHENTICGTSCKVQCKNPRRPPKNPSEELWSRPISDQK